MAKHPVASNAVDRHDLCDRVVQWKNQFFGSKWANYGEAEAGTFHLVPAPDRQAELRSDYEAMRDMYLSEPIPFHDVLETLAGLEEHINQVRRPESG